MEEILISNKKQSEKIMFTPTHIKSSSENLSYLVPNQQIGNIFLTRRVARISKNMNLNNSLFKRCFREESKRFSKQIINNCFIGKKQTFKKLFVLLLSSKNESRTIQQKQAIVKIISEANIFSQFGNDRRILQPLVENIQLVYYNSNEIIYYPNMVNNYVHKILDGQVSIKIKTQTNNNGAINQNLQDFELTRGNQPEYSILFKQQGDYLQNANNFKALREEQAISLTQTFILRIQSSIYNQMTNNFNQGKTIVKMLADNPLFNKFSPKLCQKLLEKAQIISLVKGMTLFKEYQQINTQENKKMYFVVSGEIIITKKILQRTKQICTINQGSIVGEEAVFSNSADQCRQYTASIKSLTADVLEINYKIYNDLLKKYGSNVEKNIQAKTLAEWRLNHYNKALSQMRNTQQFFLPKNNVCNLEQLKRQKLKRIVSITENTERKVENMQKIKKKRLHFHLSNIEVTFQNPLFSRNDFPNLKSLLRKFEAEQKKNDFQKLKMNKLKLNSLR